MVKFLLVSLLLVGCSSSEAGKPTDKVHPKSETVTVTEIVYVDRNITNTEIVYVDRNITNTEIVYVDRPVEVEVIVYEPALLCELVQYDSEFTGRIVYEDGSPYKRGTVKATGSTWVSQAITDDNGNFKVSIKGDERFFFSAYSPFGDFIFYDYVSPLVVPQYGTVAYECEYNIDILTCFETTPIPST